MFLPSNEQAPASDAADRNKEFQAWVLLVRSTGLRLLGCQFERGLTGSVVVIDNGQPVGAWWHRDGAYHFASKAWTGSVVEARSAEEVVSVTLSLIGKDTLESDDTFGRHQ